MHFALGKAFDDRKKFDISFNNYKAGNLIKKNKALFNISDFERDCNNQKDVCTNDLFEMKKDWGSDNMAPIFILGLPRVGST